MESPTRQTTLITRVCFQTRGRLLTRNAANPTPEDVATNSMENFPKPDHATQFKTLKDLQDDGIQPAMKAQFTALQNKFNQQMENTMNQKMKTLANVMAENMKRTIDQRSEDNARLTNQIVDLTREVRRTVEG